MNEKSAKEDPRGIEARLAAVRARIEAAALRCGRDPKGILLVAVSKKQPPAAIRLAYGAGQRVFGENYAQELVAKATELAELAGAAWHMIGHLQSNKARLLAPVAAVSMIESVDSVGLAQELGRRLAAGGRKLDVLVEVNVAGEQSKSGCRPDELGRVLDAVAAEPALAIRGLMTVPPYTDEAAAARRWFAALRDLRERHGGEHALSDLSMGMSHDFEEAIAEGATIVRVGTAIFGPRS